MELLSKFFNVVLSFTKSKIKAVNIKPIMDIPINIICQLSCSTIIDKGAPDITPPKYPINYVKPANSGNTLAGNHWLASLSALTKANDPPTPITTRAMANPVNEDPKA